MSAPKSIYEELMGLAEEFRRRDDEDVDCVEDGYTYAAALEALAKRVCAEARERAVETTDFPMLSDYGIWVARRIIGGAE